MIERQLGNWIPDIRYHNGALERCCRPHENSPRNKKKDRQIDTILNILKRKTVKCETNLFFHLKRVERERYGNMFFSKLRVVREGDASM
jgi:hypothetical protein